LSQIGGEQPPVSNSSNSQYQQSPQLLAAQAHQRNTERELTITTQLQYLRDVSLLPPSALALVLLLVVDLSLTLVHSIQEMKGRLWRYFGAIAGVWIPDVLGVLSFSLGLTVFLWVVGFAGITGHIAFFRIPDRFAIGALGLLIGGRLSDRLYSHVRLDRLGYRPNPGLTSTPYYLAEAIILIVLFFPGLMSHFIASAVGFIVGWLFFYAVLPLLRLLRVISPLRREPWKPGENMPSWALK